MGPIVPVSIVLVATVATLGDFVWFNYGVKHTMVAGIIHGALLLTAVGAALGAANGTIARGLPIGLVAGIGGALCFYALAAVLGRAASFSIAIPASWMATWVLLAVLEGKWLRAAHPRTWQAIAARGALAAIIGGSAFALVAGTLWGPPEGERNYALQLAAWAFAWTPGLLILTWGSRKSSS
jgi:hypothetical protein